MLSFQLFFEKCTPPVKVLTKYHEDPDVFISFTNSITPSTERKLPRDVEKAPNKKTNRLGLNPRTSYDTPAGIYSYPLKDYWNNIREYNIPFVKEMPYVWVFKPKNPDKVARTSTYSDSDLERDLGELSEMFPKYHIEDILKTNAADVRAAYPDYYNDDDFNHSSLHVADHYRRNPLQTFWSVTRSIARLILRDIRLSGSTKTKHITVWTHILRQFYDGIVDDTGSGTIHPNEPTQAVFWTVSHITPLELIDRTCSVNKGRGLGDSEWKGVNDDSIIDRILENSKTYKILDKIFTSKTPYKKTKLGEQLAKNGGEDMLKSLEAASNGDIKALEDAKNYNSRVIQLAFKLYFENKKDDTPFLTKDMISAISSSYLNDNVKKLLKYAKDPEVAQRLMGYYYYFSDEVVKSDIFHILRLMDEGNLYNDNIPNLFKYELSGEFGKDPKLMKFVLNYIDKVIDKPRVDATGLISSILPDYKQYYKQTGDSETLMPLLKKALTSTQLNFNSKMDLLHNIEAYGGKIMENMDELLDYLSDNSREFVGGGNQDYANAAWFKFTGKDLLPSNDSQIETIRKSRMHKPVLNKYKEGDEVAYFKQEKGGYKPLGKAVIMKVLPPYKGEFEYSVLDEDGNEMVLRETDIRNRLETKDEKEIQYGYTYEDQDGNAWRTITSPDNGRVGVKGRGGVTETKNIKDLLPFDHKNVEDTLHFKAYNPPVPGKVYIYKNDKSAKDGTLVGIKSIDPINREVEMMLPYSSYEHNTSYENLVPFNEDDYVAETLSYDDALKITRMDILRSIQPTNDHESWTNDEFPVGSIFGVRKTFDDDPYISNDGKTLKIQVKNMANLNEGSGDFSSFEILKPKTETNTNPKDETGQDIKLKEGDVLGLLMANGIVHKYIVREIDHKMKRYEFDIYTRKPNESHWKSLGESFIGFNSLNKILESSKSILAYSLNGQLKKGDALPNLEDVPLPKYSPGDVFTMTDPNGTWTSFTIVDNGEVQDNKNYYEVLLTTSVYGKIDKTMPMSEKEIDNIANSEYTKKTTDWEYLKV